MTRLSDSAVTPTPQGSPCGVLTSRNATPHPAPPTGEADPCGVGTPRSPVAGEWLACLTSRWGGHGDLSSPAGRRLPPAVPAVEAIC